MLLAKLLRLLVACILALFALSANARAMDDLQAQNTLLEKIELLPLDGPRAWLAQAVDSPEENTCFYGAFVSGPTHYNYFRSYQPTQGRYTQSDPIGLAGGLNRFGYAETNPVSFIDADGLVASRDPWFGYGGDKGFKDWWHGQKPYYGGQDIPNKEVCDNLYKDYKESNERGKGSKSGRGGKNRADKRPNVNELIRNGGKGGYGRGED